MCTTWGPAVPKPKPKGFYPLKTPDLFRRFPSPRTRGVPLYLPRKGCLIGPHPQPLPNGEGSKVTTWGPAVPKPLPKGFHPLKTPEPFSRSSSPCQRGKPL